MKKIEKINWEFRKYHGKDITFFDSLTIVLKAYQNKINEIIDTLNSLKEGEK